MHTSSDQINTKPLVDGRTGSNVECYDSCEVKSDEVYPNDMSRKNHSMINMHPTQQHQQTLSNQGIFISFNYFNVESVLHCYLV